MKLFLSIIASVLFCSIFFVPSESAPLKTYFIWFVYCICALYIANLIFKETAKWDKEDESKK
jgi:amino acid transporter